MCPLFPFLSFKNYFNWRIITLHLLWWFLRMSVWISHRYTCVPTTHKPPPTILPTLSLWFFPEHWLWVPCFMHQFAWVILSSFPVDSSWLIHPSTISYWSQYLKISLCTPGQFHHYCFHHPWLEQFLKRKIFIYLFGSIGLSCNTRYLSLWLIDCLVVAWG